jgi:hypothetical protein
MDFRPSKQPRMNGPPLAVQHAGGYAVAMDSPLFMPVLQVGRGGGRFGRGAGAGRRPPRSLTALPRRPPPRWSPPPPRA